MEPNKYSHGPNLTTNLLSLFRIRNSVICVCTLVKEENLFISGNAFKKTDIPMLQNFRMLKFFMLQKKTRQWRS